MHEGAANQPLRKVRVELGDRSYDVQIGAHASGLCGQVARARLGAACRKALVVVDDKLPASAFERVMGALRTEQIEASRFDAHASEHDKSLVALDRVLVELTRRRLERRDVVIALGGGVIGDLAGFAAAVYRRGIPFIQCPTTLLSMVDASVGGKTGVNIDLGGNGADLKKNMIGAFHQPIGVLADTLMLSSLDERHYRAGLAECVKHGMLGADFRDPMLLEWTRANRTAIVRRDVAVLAEFIERNVAIKARVVAGDEREESEGTGGRALLNLGHTFGHAIEALPGVRSVLADGTTLPGEIHHGEAVALGLRAACACAAALGTASADYAGKIGALLDTLALPVKAAGLPPTDVILERMSHDKKNVGGVTRLILPCGEARGTVVPSPAADAVRGAIETLRA
ncbi:MAG: 3-dehydroquinate synthase [Planctomycetes bacterium]|nr:3-dehydroquinate synthase [Planctomycetota bacterium]